MSYKFYEEKAKKIGKKLFVETNDSSITLSNTEFLARGKLIESQGNQYEALAIVKNVPVSRYIENKNGRLYSKNLWQKVLESGSYKGTYALADHPENEGSVKDIWGVWHEMEVKEDGVFGTLYLIEEKPVRILKSGGKLPTSTVGYGEFLEDNKTVNPDTFELERLSDIVLNPSQGTFATFENIQEDTNEIKEELQENEKKDESFLIENTNNKIKIIEKNDNNLEGVSKMNKNEILNAKNNIKIKLKSIKESTNYRESLDELEELYIDIPDELPDYKTKVAEAISQVKLTMEEKIKNTSSTLEETNNKFEELKTKYEAVNSALTEITEKYKKAEAIINKMGINEKSSFTSEDVKIMEENIKTMTLDLKQLNEDRANMEHDLNCYEEDSIAMKDDIQIFIEEREVQKNKIKELTKQIKKAEKYIEKYEKLLEDEYDYKFDDEDEEEIDADDMSENTIVTDTGQIIQPIVEAEMDDNITATDLPDSGVDYVNVVDKTDGVNNFADKEKTKVDTDSVEDYDEDVEAEGGVQTPVATQAAPAFKEEDETDVVKDLEDNDEITEQEDEDKEDEDKEEMEESYIFKYSYNDEKPKKKMVENKSNKTVQVKTTQKILNFYNEIAKDKPYVKNFAKEILSSKTLTEAVDKVSSLRKNSSNNDMIRIQESTSKNNDDTIEYKFGY